MGEERLSTVQIRSRRSEPILGDEPQTQIFAYVGLWAQGNCKLSPSSWERQEGEVTLIKLVVYENGVMPIGSMWQGFIKPRLSQPCENDFLISSFFLWRVIFLPLSLCPKRPLCVRINVEFSFGYCPLHSFTLWDSISVLQNRSSLRFSSSLIPSFSFSQCIFSLPLTRFSFFCPVQLCDISLAHWRVEETQNLPKPHSNLK